MSTRRRAIKSEPISQDCTPVKTTRTCNIDCKTSPLVKHVVENEAKDSSPDVPSPDVPYSPVIKPTQCDIEWAWKSPIGRLPNAGYSGAVTKRRLLNKTPLQKTKRQSKSNSPLNNIHLKRKLIKIDRKEEDNLSSLTSEWQALTVRKETTVVKNNETNECQYNDVDTPVVDTDSAANDAQTDGFSTLMDDDDDCFALLFCSQAIEAKLIENPNKVVFSPVLLNSSTKLTLHPSTPILSELPPGSESEPKQNNSKSSMKPENTEVLPKRHTTNITNLNNISSGISLNNNLAVIPSSKLKPTIPKNTGTVLDTNPVLSAKHHSILSKSMTKHSSFTKTSDVKSNISDDSFDTVLLSFYDENVDLLSEIVKLPANSVQHTAFKNGEITSLGNKPNTHAANIRKDVPNISTVTKSSRTITKTNSMPYPIKSNTTEDDILQPDLVNLLAQIESSSAPRAPSPPFLCTPEEIEKKRRLAKVKLERKKLARLEASKLEGINRLPNPFVKRQSN